MAIPVGVIAFFSPSRFGFGMFVSIVIVVDVGFLEVVVVVVFFGGTVVVIFGRGKSNNNRLFQPHFTTPSKARKQTVILFDLPARITRFSVLFLP